MRHRYDYLRRVTGLALAFVLAMPMWAATPAMAVGEDFVGGPLTEDMSLYVPNDHTPQAIRFSASGLTPNTDYEVKIRLSPNPAPSGNQNRGFTWNPTTGKWAQNRGPLWGEGNFPIATTDASGNIVQSPWMYYKFANENDSGTYYIIVTLNSGGDGTAQNAVTKPTVTVLDMDSNGAKVHAGANSATTIQDARRAVVAPSSSTNGTSTVWSMVRSEANGVDDDSNGAVDDEDYGLPGSMGDYLMAAPASQTVDVWVQTNRRVNDGVMGGADQDIAFGAADVTAPTAPSGLMATPADKKISLSWTASTDANGVTAYRVYRWKNVNSVEYTPLHELIGTTAGTSYEDTSTVTGGVEYNYEVRAVDAATNVSARSNAVAATSVATAPTVTAAASGTMGYSGWFKKGATPKVTLTTTATAMYAWDNAGGPFSAYGAPLTIPEGQHTLYYYATDAFDNESDVKSIAVKYDGTAPTPWISAPTFSTDPAASSKFSVKWGRTDTAASSPFANYDIEYAGADGSFGYTTSGASTTFSGVSGRSYTFRARARDAAGNVSAWTATKQTTVPYDNSSMTFTKSSSWKKSSSSSLYRGSSRYATKKGAKASMSFKGGTAVYLITTTGPTRGKAKVYVDGKYVKTVSMYSATTTYRKPIFLKSLKGSGTHKVSIVVSPTSTRSRVDVDGLAVKR